MYSLGSNWRYTIITSDNGWRWTGDKPLSDPMMTEFTDACMCHPNYMYPIVEMRQSDDHPIFWMGFHILLRCHIYIELGLWYFLPRKSCWKFHLPLTHWGWVMHLCVSKQSIIGSDNGLSPGRHQAIIWTNAGILLIGTLGTNFNELLIKIHEFSFKKIHLKMLSGKWRPSCLGLNVLSCDVCSGIICVLHFSQNFTEIIPRVLLNN